MLLLAVLALSSCRTVKDIAYFQNKAVNQPEKIDKHAGIVIQAKDMLSIVVSSRNPELVTMFNLPIVSFQAGTDNVSATGAQRLLGYVVDNDGYISLPIIGSIKADGLTRNELQTEIEKKIIESNYIADPQVNVRFANLQISVMGEVTRPGRYDIKTDKVTILDALAMAGDMTIYGNRENVAVIREVDGKNIITKLDIRSSEIFTSPCFYLEQNDIVLVSPNKYRAASAEINQNRSFWISLASTGISFATLLMTIITVANR